MNFVARVHIARLLRDDDAIGEDLTRLVEASDAGEKLAILKIARHIAGIHFEKLLEVLRGGLIVAQVHAFERQAVACERRRVGLLATNCSRMSRRDF